MVGATESALSVGPLSVASSTGIGAAAASVRAPPASGTTPTAMVGREDGLVVDDEDVLGQDPELGRRRCHHLGRDVELSAEPAAGHVQLDLDDVAAWQACTALSAQWRRPPGESTALVWSTGGIPRKVGLGATSTEATFGQTSKTDASTRVSPSGRAISFSPQQLAKARSPTWVSPGGRVISVIPVS